MRNWTWIVMLALLVAAPVRSAIAAGDAAAAGRKSPASKPSATTNPADANGPAKFYGTISAVDTAAKTFTIDNKVYSVIGETHMTKAADDSQATLDDAKVGEVARGTYTVAADGKLNVTKVRFGKKTGGSKAGGKGGKKKDDSAAAQPKQ